MSAFHCEKEQEILEAIRLGLDPSDDLRLHASSCPVCADLVLVAQFLQREADLATSEARLPDAGLVWWKAQLLARRAAAERATQPIAIAEKVAYAWGILTLLGVTIWQWPLIRGWLIRLIDFRGLTEHWIRSSLLITGVGASSLLFMAFILYIVWAEEE